MAQRIRSLCLPLPGRRQDQLLLLALLLGSLAGALSVRLFLSLRFPTLPAGIVLQPAEAAPIRRWLLGSLLPLLMTGALLLRGSALFPVLFFLHGFGGAYYLSLCSALLPGAADALLGFCFQTALPLPGLLYVGARWMEDPEDPGPCLWLLPPLLSEAEVLCSLAFMPVF